MLDFVLDLFMKYLMKGLTIIPDKNAINGSPSDGITPKFDAKEVNDLIRNKKDMIEIICDLIKLLSPEHNIRHLDDLRFIECIF